MKSPIKLIITTCLLLFIGINTSQAQRGGEPPSPEKMAERQTTRMTEKLSLTAEQVAKVKTINLAYANKFSENRKAAASNRTAIKTERQAIHKDKKAALKTVLDENQFAEYETLVENGKKKIRKVMKNKRSQKGK